MNERSLWSSHIKPRWHRPAERFVAWKVEDKYVSGAPDADCCFDGVSCKIEVKYDDKWPERESTECWFSFLNKEKTAKSIVSAIQYNKLEEWRLAGGLAFILIVVGKQWLLIEQGKYKNVPQTKQTLIEAAELVCLGEKNTWELFRTIPSFIKEHYGNR